MYTFYIQDTKGNVSVAATVTKDGVVEGTKKEIIETLIQDVDMSKKDEVMRAFRDSSFIWVREGEPKL
jgi:hypothetical protein